MKSPLLAFAAASLLAGAAVAQTVGTPTPPPAPGQPMPPEPMEPGEPPAPVPPEMPEDAMIAPTAPPAPSASEVFVINAERHANGPKAGAPLTETGPARSGLTTMQDLQTQQPATKTYPLCTRNRQDSCRNPGSR